MSGLQLCRRFYDRVVDPLLGDIPHSAALLGDGSEVLGFDDAVSTDHDFGPHMQVFVPATADADRVHGVDCPSRSRAIPLSSATLITLATGNTTRST